MEGMEFIMNRQTRIDAAVFAILVGFCVAMRLVPHAANFAPVAAAALFGAFFFSRWAWAIALPLVAMGLSDLLIGWHHPVVMLTVYAAFLFPVVWRVVLRRRLTAPRVAVGALSGSVVFFVTTNLAMWWYSPLYERTLAGLGQCYAAAIPFFRNTLIGDLVWSAALFGGYLLVKRAARALAAKPALA